MCEEKAMNCPYCGGVMELGYIHAESSHAPYWLPKGAEIKWLSTKGVENSGGFVLGKATKIGFFSTERPASYYCDHCKLVIAIQCGKGSTKE